MKKIILFLLLVQLAFVAKAQDSFKWGVRGGVNISNINSDVSTSSYTGFYTGILMEFKVNRLLSISPEINYSKEGYEYKQYYEYNYTSSYLCGTSNPLQYKSTSILNNLLIPVNVKFNIYKGLNLYIGPQLGFNLGMKIKDKVKGDYKVDSKYFKTLSFGLNTGVSYDYKFMFIEFRYNLGLTDIYEKINGKSEVFQLGVGVKF